MFSSRNLKLEVYIYIIVRFELIFCKWCEVCIEVHFFAYEYPIVPKPFFEKVLY